MFAVYDRDRAAFLERCDACGVLALAPSRAVPDGVDVGVGEIRIDGRTVTVGDAIVV
jgi:hypothetical protein